MYPVGGPVLWQRRLNHCLQHWHSVWLQIWVLVAPLPIHFPANMPRRAAKDGPSPCAPTSHFGDLEEAPAFWLWPGSIPAIDNWGHSCVAGLWLLPEIEICLAVMGIRLHGFLFLPSPGRLTTLDLWLSHGIIGNAVPLLTLSELQVLLYQSDHPPLTMHLALWSYFHHDDGI